MVVGFIGDAGEAHGHGRRRDLSVDFPQRRGVALFFGTKCARLGSLRSCCDRLLGRGRPQLVLPCNHGRRGDDHERADQQDRPKTRDADHSDASPGNPFLACWGKGLPLRSGAVKKSIFAPDIPCSRWLREGGE